MILVAVVAVVLVLVLGGSGGKSGPSAAQLAAQRAQAAHDEQVTQAELALNSYAQAWAASVYAGNASVGAERQAAASNNLDGVHAAEQSARQELQQLMAAVNRISFPAAVDQDVKNLLTAATNASVEADSLANASDFAAFNAGFQRLNDATHAMNDANVSLRHDLQSLITG